MKQIVFYILTALLLASTSGFAQKKVSYTYPNGNKKEEGTWVEGEKDGKWTKWFENGNIEEEIVYKKGEILNKKTFNSSGYIVEEKNYTIHPKFVYTKLFTFGRLYIENFTAPNGKTVAYENTYNPTNESFSSNSYHIEIDGIQQKNGFPSIYFHKDGSIHEVRCGRNVVGWHENGVLREVSGYFYDGTYIRWYRWNESGERVDNMLRVIKQDTATFDKNGIKPKLQYSFKGNRPHGVWKDYYTNGQLWFEIEYDNGVPKGDYQSFYFNGKPQLKAHFTNGFVDGPYTEWYDNGNKRMEGNMKLCLKDGTWKYWNENGTLGKIESFKNGILDGEFVFWDSDGVLKEKKYYKNGKLEGWEHIYYAKDTLKSVKYYMNGYSNYGEQKEFFRNGNLDKLSYNNVNLKMHYFKEGNLISVNGDLLRLSWYKDGTLEAITYSENGNNFAYLHFRNGQITSKNCRINGQNTDSIPYAWMYPKDGKLELKQVGDSVNGKREGTWKLYYPSGDVWIEMSYKNDLLDGEYIVRTVNGQIVKKVQLTNGLRNGTYEEWSSAGNKLVEEFYKNGKLEGSQKKWKEGEKYYLYSIAHYSNNQLNGDSYTFLENGDTLSHSCLKNGVSEGIEKVYDRDEHYHYASYMYKNGIKDGEATIYFPNGKVEWKGNFYNDKRHGEWIQYNEAGKVIDRKQYEFGDEILAPTDIECQCTTNYNKASDLKFAPAIFTFYKYEPFFEATSKYFTIDKKVYEQLFYKNFQTMSNLQALTVVALDTVWFETPAAKGLRFVVNPCLTRNQYSTTELYFSITDPIQEDRRFHSNSTFDYQAKSYFRLALRLVEYEMNDSFKFLSLCVDFLLKSHNISRNDAYKELKNLGKEHEIPPTLLNRIERIDKMSEEEKEKFKYTLELDDDFWMGKRQFINVFAETYFNQDTVNEEFESRFNLFFEDIVTFEYFSELTVAHYEARTDINQIAIDFPQNILTQWDTKHKKVLESGARLLLSIDPIKISSKNGFSLTNQRDFCFTTAAIGGKNCVLKTDKAEVYPTANDFSDVLGTTMFYFPDENATHVQSTFEKFISDNGYSSFAGVYIPKGFGTIKRNKKEIDITYDDIFITGEYILGQLHMTNNSLNDKKLTKLMQKYFPVYQIETNSKEETVIYFLYK